MSKIYLDNAATTPLSDEVIQEMVSAMKSFGNPSSTHSFGQEAKILIENVRRSVAQYLRVSPAEIIFTSCGTESNNMIIKSSVLNLGVERIITTPIEHKCITETVKEVKKNNGTEIRFLDIAKDGSIDYNQLEQILQESNKKTLVSLMHANNEIGNLLDLEKTAKICKKYGALFHSDTVQTIGHIDLDFSKIPIDFAASSAHKFHGPKGSGFAFIRKSSGLKSLISGGTQERNLRAGTENVAGIVGLGKALSQSLTHLNEYTDHIKAIKKYAIEQFKSHIIGVKFNGLSDNLENSLYTILSISLPFYDSLIGMKLDMQGIAISQGSACSSGAAKPSSVLDFIIDKEDQNKQSTIRVSFSHLTTVKDIDTLIKAVVNIQKSIL